MNVKDKLTFARVVGYNFSDWAAGEVAAPYFQQSAIAGVISLRGSDEGMQSFISGVKVLGLTQWDPVNRVRTGM